MPTGQAIVTNALKTLGICEQGGTPSVSDSTDTLAELNVMWEAWGIDEGLIFAIQSVSKALSTTVASYTIGAGAAFDTPRPSRIYKAYFTLAGNRNELEIVEAGRYFSHNDLTASAATPDELYPDFNVDPTTGYGKLYLWPVPTFASGAPQLELETGAPFSTWALGTNYNLAAGYQDAIQKTLAFRMISYFGAIVEPRIVETVTAEAQKAEARIRGANMFNRKLPPEAAGLMPPAAAKG